jgi:hypothetical protein
VGDVMHMEKIAMTDEELDARFTSIVESLPLGPGSCVVDGCRQTLLCVAMEPWDGKGEVPPARFACPLHDVWIGHCFDTGDPDDPEYSDGMYVASLRDPSDRTWRWLPPYARSAAAKAGFCALDPYAYPRLRVVLCDGRVWGTDGKTMVALGAASDLPAIEARIAGDIHVTPESKTQEVLATYRLPDNAPQKIFARYRGPEYSPTVAQKPSARGYLAERWDLDARAYGDAVVPERICLMLEEMFGCTWAAAGRVDPVFAVRDGEIVGAVMPIDTIERERIERKDVCHARHVFTSEDGRVFRNYSCELEPGHAGKVHEIRALGGARLWWDEREHARTDELADVGTRV